MGKVIYLNSQETKDELAEKCFFAISKSLYNLNEKTGTEHMTLLEIIEMFCKKYKLTKEEFIQGCDNTGNGTYLRELMSD